MSIEHEPLVKELATNKPTAVQTFTISGTAVTNFRSFASAYTNGDVTPVFASNADNSMWEESECTLSTGVLTRTTILKSSNSNAAVDFSGSATDITLSVGHNSSYGTQLQLNNVSVIPGGRLTTTSGNPFDLADQTGKTTIYYTPFTHNIIPLWNGTSWVPVEFSETSLAVGTVTAHLPYDIFAYISGGVLALEKVAWTNATTRATALAQYDGRYCKSGDKSRLHVGMFAAATTTGVDDRLAYRGLWNRFNKATKMIYYSAGAPSHTWAPGAVGYREYNGDTDTHIVRYVCDDPSAYPGYVSGIIGTNTDNAPMGVAVLINTLVDANLAGQAVNFIAAYDGAMNGSIIIGALVPGLNKIILADRSISSVATQYVSYGSFRSMVSV